MSVQVFKALGDPIRLEMVERLSSGRSYTIGELTSNLSISRQGARKQVQTLVSANLVRLKPHGREVKVHLDLQSLQRSREFIARLEHQWDTRLNKLKEVVEKK